MRVVAIGELAVTLSGGAARWLAFDGTEVVRGIDYPVRDAQWATLPTRTLEERLEEQRASFTYTRRFAAGDAFEGAFNLHAKVGQTAEITAEVALTALREVRINRAGFVVLHPLAGVAGEPLTVTHPDGSLAELAFPSRISPSQPVFDIAALAHVVDGVRVTLSFEGETFEMEDQRNWTDASYKTYCRPLGRPRPFQVAQGERIEQRITVRMERVAPPAARQERAAARGRAPKILLAVDEAFGPAEPSPALAEVPFEGVQLRLAPPHTDAKSRLARATRLGHRIDLEIVLPEGEAPGAVLGDLAAAAGAAGVAPRRVIALPEPYLKSIQPEGPWPQGPTPEDAAEAARAAFPAAEIGGGVLTNFTELNRRPPDFPSDHVSFGTTAIVHAADDASVLETLEALPEVFASARAIAGERPLSLGLVAIAMRSNPYGAGVAQNPNRERVAMATADPRQDGLFAAAFAVGAVAAAIEAGVSSLSLAMATGPLGLEFEDGSDRLRPLYHAVRALALIADTEVAVSRRDQLVEIVAPKASGLNLIAANLGPTPAEIAHEGGMRILDVASFDGACATPKWLDTAPLAGGPQELGPLAVAFGFSPDGSA